MFKQAFELTTRVGFKNIACSSLGTVHSFLDSSYFVVNFQSSHPVFHLVFQFTNHTISLVIYPFVSSSLRFLFLACLHCFKLLQSQQQLPFLAQLFIIIASYRFEEIQDYF